MDRALASARPCASSAHDLLSIVSMPLVRTLVDSAKRSLKSSLAPVLRQIAPRRIDLPPARWGLDARPGQLAFEGHDLHALLSRWGSPLHVVLGSRLRANADAFRPSAPRDFEVYYSYKTNPIPGVLRFLHGRGIGAEVISHYELWLALELGVPPEKIIYNGPAKSDASLVLAMERNIGLLNVNHAEEIAHFAALARRVGSRPRVGVRVSLQAGWSGQFGVPAAAGAALEAFDAAFAEDVLDVVALHAHLGHPIAYEPTLIEFVRSTLAFADELHARTRKNLEILDFGGSLCTPTVEPIPSFRAALNRTFHCDLLPPNVEARLGIERYLQILVEMVDEHYAKRKRPRPRIFLEPGRAMTGDTQLLLASVLTTKQDRDVCWAVLDAGMNVASCVQNEYHQLFAVNRHGEAASGTYRLAGPICTPADVTYAAWELPRLEPGDSLCIMDSGAYFVPFATSFSFPQPGVVLLDSGVARSLRRAETFGDLVALDEAHDRGARLQHAPLQSF